LRNETSVPSVETSVPSAEGMKMYRILGINKHTFKIEEIAVASNYAELKLILRQERKEYQAIWYVRA
jgi:hypothetical protein